MNKQYIEVARGGIDAHLVLKNASIINVFTESLEVGDVAICDDTIVGIGSYHGIEEIDCTGLYLSPGFIDAHIHLESSMTVPHEFAKIVLPHGTTAVITDPHEIANVCGTKGIDYMIEATKDSPLSVYFMLPSCVPATPFDESGAILYAKDLEPYYKEERVLGLAEVMNYVGAIHGDLEILDKIQDAKKYNKKVDGHAPGVNKNELNAYLTAGVQSDHECSNETEGKERIKRGQWVMIRQGTAAKNLKDLMSLFEAPYYNRCMLVTDDKHPGALEQQGHMDYIIKKSVEWGADPIRAIKMASWNPASYFGLKEIGAIAPGYKADLLIIDDLSNMYISKVFKNGKLVSQDGEVQIEEPVISKHLLKHVCQSFHMPELSEKDFMVEKMGNSIRVMGLKAGQLLTEHILVPFCEQNNGIQIEEDIIKLAVVERHLNTGHIGLAYLKGYGLNAGAIASSVAHDSHNLIIAGVNESDMVLAGNHVRENQGGWAIALDGQIVGSLPLPIAGLMSECSGMQLDNKISRLKEIARTLGVRSAIDPFMTLAFMSLPVIPDLKLTTMGLIDVKSQSKIGLWG